MSEHNDIRDRGSTLVEVVVTIVLIGTVVVGLPATRMSVIASSTRTRARNRDGHAQRGDRVQRAPQICSYRRSRRRRASQTGR